ncbi:unnamed product [Ostreococcus tauri]|uniref:Unnamed product n=1 Tax=Ostreococcus tauri TaxID=70448 RepID=A0A096PAE5_OSTTA|nr:unnamed product [Ostreococcus tauri]CEG01282.1 unnamed product [Ostreococcus tauri]|eukprot:XP_003075349.2 unnamed product [Ostreococcus tauri]
MPTPFSPRRRENEIFFNHERALRRAVATQRTVTQAMQRAEVNAWTHQSRDDPHRASDDSADAIELRALHRVNDNLSNVVNALRQLTTALRSNDELDRRRAESLSEHLERARRDGVRACARALESATSERNAVRECMEFLEVPGDREMIQREEEARERSMSEEYDAATRTSSPASFLHAEPKFVDDEDVDAMSEEEATKMFAQYNAFSAPMTPQNLARRGGVSDVYVSEVKSSRGVTLRDSPGGMSEDSAYGSPNADTKGDKTPMNSRGKRASSGNGGIWAGVALGALAVGAAMRFAATPQAAALQAVATMVATHAKRGVVGAATVAKSASSHAHARVTEMRAQSKRQAAKSGGLEAPYQSVKRSFAETPAVKRRWKPAISQAQG